MFLANTQRKAVDIISAVHLSQDRAKGARLYLDPTIIDQEEVASSPELSCTQLSVCWYSFSSYVPAVLNSSWKSSVIKQNA